MPSLWWRRASAAPRSSLGAHSELDGSPKVGLRWLARLRRYASNGAGSLGLLEMKRMMGALDATFGWEHSSTAVLSLFRLADEGGTGRLDIGAVTNLLRKLHGLPEKRKAPQRSRLSALLADPASTSVEPHRPPAAAAQPSDSVLSSPEPRTPGSSFPSGGYAEASRSPQPHTGSPQARGGSPQPGSSLGGSPTRGSPTFGRGGSLPAGRGGSPPSGIQSQYRELLRASCHNSVARRNALEHVPFEEMELIFDVFERHDTNLDGMLDFDEFVDLWRALRAHPRSAMKVTGRGLERVTVTSLLLKDAPDLRKDALRVLFNKSDVDRSGKLDINELVAALADSADEAYAEKAMAAASSLALRDFRRVRTGGKHRRGSNPARSCTSALSTPPARPPASLS